MGKDWDEVNAQKDGSIERQTAFRDLEEMILQGPHIYVGNPFFQTPRRNCNSHRAYDNIDLVMAPDNYLPRTNFGPAVCNANYRSRMTRCHWNQSMNHTDHYRVGFRSRLNSYGERTLIGAILAPGFSHIHTIQSVAFVDEVNSLNLYASSCSIIHDFVLKASGKQDLGDDELGNMIWISPGQTAISRALRLSCLTTAYADLWNRHRRELRASPWSFKDKRLEIEGDVSGPLTWDRTAGIRTDIARRLALVEIDVLVAQTLDLTLEQLIEIYRIYFPVLQENEAGTWYDDRGRIVWTCSKGLPGVGYIDPKSGKRPGRTAWEKLLARNPSKLECNVVDDTQPEGPRNITREFFAPFTRHDREEDYRIAWKHFERLRAEGHEI